MLKHTTFKTYFLQCDDSVGYFFLENRIRTGTAQAEERI